MILIAQAEEILASGESRDQERRRSADQLEGPFGQLLRATCVPKHVLSGYRGVKSYEVAHRYCTGYKGPARIHVLYGYSRAELRIMVRVSSENGKIQRARLGGLAEMSHPRNVLSEVEGRPGIDNVDASARGLLKTGPKLNRSPVTAPEADVEVTSTQKSDQCAC